MSKNWSAWALFAACLLVLALGSAWYGPMLYWAFIVVHLLVLISASGLLLSARFLKRPEPYQRFDRWCRGERAEKIR